MTSIVYSSVSNISLSLRTWSGKKVSSSKIESPWTNWPSFGTFNFSAIGFAAGEWSLWVWVTSTLLILPSPKSKIFFIWLASLGPGSIRVMSFFPTNYVLVPAPVKTPGLGAVIFFIISIIYSNIFHNQDHLVIDWSTCHFF